MIRNCKLAAVMASMLAFSYTACTNPQQVKTSQKNEKADKPLAQEVLQSVNDSLNAWLASGVQGVQFLKSTVWRVDDMVLTNSEMNKGFLLLLTQDKNPDAERDFVQILYVRKQDERWITYLASLPNIAVKRKQIDGKFVASTLTELAEAGHQEINSRYINSSGIPDDHFLDEEYSPELETKQRAFLSKKTKP